MASKKSLPIKTLVPVLIVAAIAVIWLVKNPDALTQPAQSAPTATPTTAATDTTSETELSAASDADFTLEVTKMVDFEALAEYQLPVIVDYGSDSCIPCKEMAPVLEKMNTEFAGKVFIKFVDVWKHGEAAGNVPVQVIPTQVLFNANGTPFTPSETLAGQIQFTMYSSKETDEHVFTVHQGGLTEPQMRAILKEMGVE